MSCLVSLETRNSKLSNALERTSTWITHTGNGATKQSNFTFYSQTDINLYSRQSISPKRRITMQMMKIVFFFLYCISIVISMVKQFSLLAIYSYSLASYLSKETTYMHISLMVEGLFLIHFG